MNSNSSFKLNFDNKVLRELPIDTSYNKAHRTTPNVCFSLIHPTPVTNPKTVAISEDVLNIINFPIDEIKDVYKNDEFAEYFSGNKAFDGSQTAAHCYCGHQFGHFSGQLGDGATMYLGEILNNKNERWEIQFKGAGQTPYSRGSDGRKVLRSSIREFLCSEFMHALHIPTTRAGTIVTSDTLVERDIFYTGNPINEKATIITRVAPTFIRFGSFEIIRGIDNETNRPGSSPENYELGKKLLDYTINSFYSYLKDKNPSEIDLYRAFYAETVTKSAKLVAKWQGVGWTHGVLNTDNISIAGLTIDYGPYGFMEFYVPNFVPNKSDDSGRYAYSKQPDIMRWNCNNFGETINHFLKYSPLERENILKKHFDFEFQQEYKNIMIAKLGLAIDAKDSDGLIGAFMKAMEVTYCDWTNSFRILSQMTFEKCNNIESIVENLISNCAPKDWIKILYKPILSNEQFSMLTEIAKRNPHYLYQIGFSPEKLIAENEKLEKLKYFETLNQDSLDLKNREIWTVWLNSYHDFIVKHSNSLGDSKDSFLSERISTMNNINPKIVLRNSINQHAIELAEKNDFTEVRNILKTFSNPYVDTPETEKYVKISKVIIECSCSS